MRALDAIPNRLAAFRPLDETVDSLGNVPEKLGSVGSTQASDRVDIERDDVSAAGIARIVIKAGSRAPSDPGVVGDALAEVEHHRPGRVGGSQPLVIRH